MSKPAYLAGYLAKVLPTGALQMRDPNDRGKHRYCWAWIDGVPSRIRLPDTGDFRDVAAEWEPISASMRAQVESAITARRLGVKIHSHPIIDYFARSASKNAA